MIFEFFEEFLKAISVKLVASIVVGSVATYVIVDNQTKNDEENRETAETSTDESISLKNSKKTRNPASLSSTLEKSSPSFQPAAKISSYEESNFVSPTNSSSTPLGQQSGYQANSKAYKSSSAPKSGAAPLTRTGINESTKNPDLPLDKETPKTVANEEAPLVPIIKTTDDKKLDNTTGNSTTTSSSSSASATASTPTANSCSTNIVGGAFGNPVGITLSCLYPSTIKYCLSSNGTCCDPESSGNAYSSKIVIGPGNGNYCLSYIGDSVSGGSSIVYQQNYTINSTFPNLSVGHSKIFYQTTELLGTSFINSQDFGKANFSIGQINLKNHNPGPEGLNYSCDDIITNYVALRSPNPIEVLSLFDVSLVSLNSQVEIPLRLDQLDYGDNFITSYIGNSSFVVPLYSCSTTKINLDDFEYFQADVSQSIAGDNSVREFEGEFSAYGFFEEESVVFRGPAGVSTVEKTGQNLKSGMYGMFY